MGRKTTAKRTRAPEPFRIYVVPKGETRLGHPWSHNFRGWLMPERTGKHISGEPHSVGSCLTRLVRDAQTFRDRRTAELWARKLGLEIGTVADLDHTILNFPTVIAIQRMNERALSARTRERIARGVEKYASQPRAYARLLGSTHPISEITVHVGDNSVTIPVIDTDESPPCQHRAPSILDAINERVTHRRPGDTETSVSFSLARHGKDAGAVARAHAKLVRKLEASGLDFEIVGDAQIKIDNEIRFNVRVYLPKEG
jgi:hypothetical protein